MPLSDIQNGNASKRKGMSVMIAVMVIHLVLVYKMQTYAGIGGDGIFSYTLANTPYSFEYLGSAYKRLPQSNGWISAHVLRECYIVEDYDRFHYSPVYFHQRMDVHPLLYYTFVHTICSIFAGTYSNMHTMVINWIFLCAIDILIIKFFGKMYGKMLYATVPFAFLFLMPVIQKLCVLPRMYMALSFFCLWYLYIHWNLFTSEKWKKSYLAEMALCIFLGSQTHYYFYVYACSLTAFAMVYFVLQRKKYELLNYIYSGFVGIAASWILFPWIIWHIFFNQQQKHMHVTPWSVEKLRNYMLFLNYHLFNGRGLAAILALMVLSVAGIILRRTVKAGQTVRKLQNGF